LILPKAFTLTNFEIILSKKHVFKVENAMYPYLWFERVLIEWKGFVIFGINVALKRKGPN